ncbi:MAG: serine/threonine protein kinase [Deltaproteobacteria bacterium]|nr:serine/threonine protein kinase [Deltaproteobacteria bacterium]
MPSPASELQRNLAGRQLGRYEVLTQLASGGMAAVYVARAKGVAGFERLVAIKVLHPHLAYEEEFISMFLDEARLAARIRHPNVVPTLDISDTEGDGFFLVMEYIEGDHFGTLLGAAAKEGERLPTPIVSKVLIDALGGLAAAHELSDENGEPLKLVHRDISPHNVMVGVDGISRLTDFGVAKAEKRLTSTRAGQFKGKLAYMSPEQASSGFADQRSDLFSMGIMLWESLSGRRLFRGENNAATLTKILHEPIPAPSELWEDLKPFDELLAKALHREPDERFQSADEFAAALEQVARANGGIASTRAVGKQVRARLADKLEAQRDRVKDSIRKLGRTDLSEAAIPIPRESSVSNVSLSGTRPLLPPDAQTLSATPSAMQLTPGTLPNEDKGRSMLPIFATLAVLLMAGAGIAVGLSLRGSDAEEPAPAAAPPPAETVEEAPAAAAEPIPLVPAPTGDPIEDEIDEELEAEAEAEVEDEPETSRQRRTRRRRPATTEATPMEEAVTMAEEPAVTEAEMTAPSMRRTTMMSNDDDLLFNPYRR